MDATEREQLARFVLREDQIHSRHREIATRPRPRWTGLVYTLIAVAAVPIVRAFEPDERMLAGAVFALLLVAVFASNEILRLNRRVDALVKLLRIDRDASPITAASIPAPGVRPGS